ncbi:MAG TPA: MmgE/PrpD family protein, partial [Trueperaceae bacterium]|nr:MmgE/PrpD family protein [Trueperaceae bacterium]
MITLALAEYISSALSKPLPTAVVLKAKHHVLDTIAAMLSGTQLLPGERALAYARRLGGPAEAFVLGSVIGGMYLCAPSSFEAALCLNWGLTTDVVSGTWSIKRTTKVVSVTPETGYANTVNDPEMD